MIYLKRLWFLIFCPALWIVMWWLSSLAIMFGEFDDYPWIPGKRK